MLEDAGLAKAVCKRLSLPDTEPDLTEWTAMVKRSLNLSKKVRIALVGKYVSLHDAYISVVESLKHGGIENDAEVDIKWVDSETVTEENSAEIFADCDGIIVPGGFGDRGIEGMILAAKYARENNVPYFGICLGMQISVIEYARDVLGYADANSTELDPDTAHPVIHIMPDQKNIEDMGGTMRLGQYPCELKENTRCIDIYKEKSQTPL